MQAPEAVPRFERQEVELPDGRRLIYYWFPHEPRPEGGAPAGAEAAPAPPPEES